MGLFIFGLLFSIGIGEILLRSFPNYQDALIHQELDGVQPCWEHYIVAAIRSLVSVSPWRGFAGPDLATLFTSSLYQWGVF